MKIEVFGSGCAKCKKTLENAQKAVKELNIKADIITIFDLKEVVQRGISSTPALMVDGKLICSGRVPEISEIKDWLSGKNESLS